MGETRCEAMERRIEALEARVAEMEREKSERMRRSEEINRIIEAYPVDMNKTQAALVLGVTRATVYTMINDGRLEMNARGRVLTHSLVQLLTGPYTKRSSKKTEGESK